MIFFTDMQRSLHRKHSGFLGGLFIRGILYMCIVCLLNTLFFAIIKQSPHLSKLSQVENWSDQGPIKTVSVKFAKSLLRLVLDKYLTTTDAGADDTDAVQEEVHKIEYIPQ